MTTGQLWYILIASTAIILYGVTLWADRVSRDIKYEHMAELVRGHNYDRSLHTR